jgi:DDE superfamily endonuclease
VLRIISECRVLPEREEHQRREGRLEHRQPFLVARFNQFERIYISDSLSSPTSGEWRHVKVTDRHTAVDYARVLKDLADIHFAHAKTIVLVQDNLSIHSKASLYEAFPAIEARRLIERFEWHYTPKHGSWLNLAESELGVLTSQCLNRRTPSKQILIEEIAAWEHDRNANHTKADWQFTTKNARIKLKHLYPAI